MPQKVSGLAVMGTSLPPTAVTVGAVSVQAITKVLATSKKTTC